MHKLLSMFLLTLATHGLAPDALDPWRGWMAFKEFVRSVDEEPDPGVSVQFTRWTERGYSRLVFVRQEVTVEDDLLEPVGGVVCEFTFPRVPPGHDAWDHWTFDHASFERFVDIVENEPVFQQLMVTRAMRSAVYWEEA